MEKILHKSRKKTKFKQARVKEILFLAILFTLPIIHTVIFYFGQNIQSILLAFEKYDVVNEKYAFNGFRNFVHVFRDIQSSKLVKTSMINALIFWCVGTFINAPLCWFCSYFIVKKVPFSEFFKVVFFLPSMISSVVMVLMFKYFCEYAVSDVAVKLFGVKKFPILLMEEQYALKTLIGYSIWHNLASGMILYLGALTRVSDGVIDAAQIDGANHWQEFWHVFMPELFSTQVVTWITSIVGIFTAGAPIFTFYGNEAPTYVYNTSYYLFMKVVGENATLADYPYAAAAAMCITLIAAPITFFLKWFLGRVGPTEE